MPTRTVVLTAIIASCVSSLVTLAAALLVLAPSIRAAPDLQTAQPVVRAERFEVVDQDGRILARLGQQSPGTPVGALWTSRTSLEFVDQVGQPRAVIGMSTNDMPALSIADGRGTSVGIGQPLMPDGSPTGGVSLSMGTRNEQVRALHLVLGASGSDVRPHLLLFDNNRPRIELGVLSDGSPLIRQLDETDQVIWQAP